MSDQFPFEPPSTPPLAGTTPPAPPGPRPLWTADESVPVSPVGPRSSGSGRGKLALVALAGAAVTGGAIFGISQFADANDPVLTGAPAAEAPATPAARSSERIGAETTGTEPVPTAPPTPLSLPPGMPPEFAEFADCIGAEELLANLPLGSIPFDQFPLGSIPFDQLPMGSLPIGDGQQTVTVSDGNGVTTYVLGDADASVTVTKSGDSVEVTTTGDVTEGMSFQFDEIAELMGTFAGGLEGGEFAGLAELFDDLAVAGQSSGPSGSVPVDFGNFAECLAMLEGHSG